MPVRVIGCDYRRIACEEELIKNCQEYVVPEPKNVDPWCVQQLRGCNEFGLEYLIAALLSRGAIVKDQILVTKKIFSKLFLKNSSFLRDILVLLPRFSFSPFISFLTSHFISVLIPSICGK